MKYLHYEGNKIIGCYSKDIHDFIPEPHIEIKDEQWQKWLSDQASYVIYNNALLYQPYTPTEAEVKKNKITALNSEYNEQIAAVKAQIYDLEIISKDTAKADVKRNLLSQLKAEYQTKLGAIKNGTA